MTISLFTSTGKRLESSDGQSVEEMAAGEALANVLATDGESVGDAGTVEQQADAAVEEKTLSDARSWFSHDVTAVIEPDDEIVVRVRARERPRARLDTYFVRYDGPAHSLQSEVSSFLREECEYEFVEDSGIDYATVARDLSVSGGRWPAEAPAIELLRQVIADGHAPVLKVSDHAIAGKMAYKLSEELDVRIAIMDASNQTSAPPSADIAIGVVPGLRKQAIIPTSRTQSWLEKARESQREARVATQRETIREAVETLRHETDLDNAEVRDILLEEAPEKSQRRLLERFWTYGLSKLLIVALVGIPVLGITVWRIVGWSLTVVSQNLSEIPILSLPALGLIGGGVASVAIVSGLVWWLVR